MRSELLWIFMVDFSKGWGVREHSHDFYQIWYILSGSADYALNRRLIHIQEGNLLLLRPGDLHELPVMKSGLLRYIDIKFSVGDKELRRRLELLPSLSAPEGSELKDTLLKCRSAWYTTAEFSREIAALQFEQALLLYARREQPAADDLPVFSQIDAAVQGLTGVEAQIAAYIDDHYAERLTLEGLAATFCYNKNYLCKIFKQATDLTIIHFINLVRVSKALELICYSTHALSLISAMVGFSDIHYFTRVFKQVTGSSPGKVREQQRNSMSRDLQLHGNFNFRYYFG